MRHLICILLFSLTACGALSEKQHTILGSPQPTILGTPQDTIIGNRLKGLPNTTQENDDWWCAFYSCDPKKQAAAQSGCDFYGNCRKNEPPSSWWYHPDPIGHTDDPAAHH